MAENQTKQTYQTIILNLKHGRLGKALAEFRVLADQPLLSTAAICEEAQSLEADHKRLLNYFCSNSIDPQREILYDQLIERTWQLADRLYDVAEPMTVAVSMGDVILRLAELNADPGSDEALGATFEQVADSRHLTHDELQELHQAILNEHLPEYVRATLLSALSLHILRWFDAEATELLYTYTLDDQPTRLQMQAWVTLVCTLLLHQERIAHLPRLKAQYAMMAEDNAALLYDIQEAIITCREARQADARLRQIARKIDDDDEEGLKRRARELYDYLSQGVDTSYNLFTQLGRMRFFAAEHNRHHWLMPFSMEHPVIRAIIDHSPKAEPWVTMLKMSVAQCDTDKYSAVISMNKMNDSLMAAIGEQMTEKGLDLAHLAPLPPSIVKQNYLHDLYRFYSLRLKNELGEGSPFAPHLLLTGIGWLQEFLPPTARLEQMVTLLMRQEQWSAAAEMNERVLRQEESERALLRQATCFHQMSLEGLDAGTCVFVPLMRSRQLYPESRETLRMLADMYRHEGNHGMEEATLSDALAQFPDDGVFLRRMGRCLNDQRRHPEALSYLFKADILQEGRPSVMREILRALIATGDTVRAELYADRVTCHDRVRSTDWLLAGHVALQSGDIALALERYQHIGNQADTEEAFTADERMLLDVGIEPHVIGLMKDLLIASKEAEKQANNEIEN